MGIHLADQALVFLLSLLVGAALGFLYDVFRISRIAFPTPAAVLFAEDILFFLICAVVTFFFGLSAIDGVLRFFLFIGELLGAVLYVLIAGRIVMRVSRTVIAAIKKVLAFIARWILRPVWLLFYHIVSLILRPFTFLFRFLKKKLQNMKFRLKVGRKVLYNQFTGSFRSRKRKKKPRVGKHEDTQKSVP